jgi:DNA polymerase III alpha subunit (gram-positive type)
MARLWLILDVETTGLDPETAGVWQLGYVLWRDGRIIREGVRWVRPEERHWSESHRSLARRISGLTAAEEVLIAEAWTLEQEIRALLQGLAEWQAPIVATSYNLPFERSFLDREPQAISRLAAEAGIDWGWGPCLMTAAVNVLDPIRPRLSLRSACLELDIPWSGSHRALADARLAAQVGERLGVFESSAYS